MPNTLIDKVAIITGASRGIGSAIARRFAAEGARVVITARTLEEGGKLPGSLEKTAEQIRAGGGECLTIAADLAKPPAPDPQPRRPAPFAGKNDATVAEALPLTGRDDLTPAQIEVSFLPETILNRPRPRQGAYKPA